MSISPVAGLQTAAVAPQNQNGPQRVAQQQQQSQQAAQQQKAASDPDGDGDAGMEASESGGGRVDVRG